MNKFALISCKERFKSKPCILCLSAWPRTSPRGRSLPLLAKPKPFTQRNIFQDTDIFLLENSSCSLRRARKVSKNIRPRKALFSVFLSNFFQSSLDLSSVLPLLNPFALVVFFEFPRNGYFELHDCTFSIHPNRQYCQPALSDFSQ